MVGDDVLGSMEYACAVAGAKLVVVLGHTACGAVQGAIDDVILGNLTGLLSSIKGAVQATPYEGTRTSANREFVDLVAHTHAARTVTLIRERSPVLRKMEQDGQIKIVAAMYDIETAHIALL